MKTSDFKTKTILKPRRNPSADGYWGVAIDVGYSSVKIFAPNMVASFPAFAMRVPAGKIDSAMGGRSRSAFGYRGEDGSEWLVGADAQEALSEGRSDNSTATLYSRDRFDTEMFRVIARAGLALGLTANQFGTPEGRELFVQTGLPPAYMRTNSADLKESLSGRHRFELKIGDDAWMTFDFALDGGHIDVMPQPMGTLLSIATDAVGKPLPQSMTYMRSNLLVFDPGFGTLDTFYIKNFYIESHNTFDNLGMRRVMQETADGIFAEHGKELSVPVLQKHLASGKFTKLDKKRHKDELVDFSGILEEASRRVCMEALRTIDETYDYLQDVDFFVVTGGTGAAWMPYIRKYYDGMGSLTILSGAVNDSVDPVFANVRGYYMNQLNQLRKAAAGEGGRA